MRNTYVELSEFFAPLLALFARPSACFLGVVLVAMTLSSFLFPGYGYSQEIIARSDELEEKIVRCDERVVCSTQEWEEIEELAEKTEGDVKRVRKVRESEQKAELEVLDFYLETCGRSELERDQKSRCRSGFWSGVNLGGIETIAENEGEEKAEQLRKVREALEPKESELSVATSLDIQAFGNLADDVIAQMGADLFLREELRATGPEPTLLVTPITNRSNANIDTPIVNDTLQVRLYEANQFTLVNWNPLAEKTLLQEQYPIPSVDLLADSHNVTSARAIGRSSICAQRIHSR